MMVKKTIQKLAYLFVCLIFVCFQAEAVNFPDIVSISSEQHRNRVISEASFLKPIDVAEDSVILFDTKLKQDNRKTTEINLGFAYRKLFDDRFIAGVYGYYDRKNSRYHLAINQATIGAEVLTEDYDFRFNAYVPERKIKQIGASNISLANEGTKIFAIKRKDNEEHALRGYDIEFGFPLFAFAPSLHQQLDTKFFVSKYRFHKNNVATNDGVRLRLEQKLLTNLFDTPYSNINLFTGITKTQKRKTNSFIGLKLNIALFNSGNKKHYEASKIQRRMMNPIIRDIDIVTAIPDSSKVDVVPVFVGTGGARKIVDNVYFVIDSEDTNYQGDGTSGMPFSRSQLSRMIREGKVLDVDIVVPLSTKTYANTYECLLSQFENKLPEVSGQDFWVRTQESPLSLSRLFTKVDKNRGYVPRMFSNLNAGGGSDKEENIGVIRKNDDDLHFIIGSPTYYNRFKKGAYVSMPPLTPEDNIGIVQKNDNDMHIVIGSPTYYQNIKQGENASIPQVATGDEIGEVKKGQDDLHFIIGSP